MAHTVRDIAAALGADFAGDGGISLGAAAEPALAGPGDLAIALSPSFAADLPRGAGRAALLWPGADWQAMGLAAAIFAPRGRLALSRLSGLLAPDDYFGAGIDPAAVIDPAARLGPDVSVGPLTVIAAGAEIGAGSRIGALVSIGRDARIGPQARLHDGCRIGPRVVAGARLVVQPGAAIGGDGFSFVTETPSGPERAKVHQGTETLTATERPDWHKIESLGGVSLGDDVEIGANASVDAGTIRPTRIGDGTKIDSLVQVGHNVVIGRHCLLCAQVGVAGSTVIGDRVVLGGQSGVADHLTIGDDVVAGGASVILNSVPKGRVLLGYPAQRMSQALAAYKTLRRLGRATKPVPKQGPSE